VSSREELNALRNLLTQADRILETSPILPENRTAAFREFTGPKWRLGAYFSVDNSNNGAPSLVLTSRSMNLIGLDFTYAPKDKERQKTSIEPALSQSAQSLVTLDVEFLLMLLTIVALSGAIVMLSGMAMAHSARR
jgi:hypothetical protein